MLAYHPVQAARVRAAGARFAALLALAGMPGSAWVQDSWDEPFDPGASRLGESRAGELQDFGGFWGDSDKPDSGAAPSGHEVWEAWLEGESSQALNFAPIGDLTASGGWRFEPGDGAFTQASSASDAQGLQISHPAPMATSILISYTGSWSNGSRPEFYLEDNTLYAARAVIAANIGNTFVDGAKPRLRLEPTTATFGIDYTYTINENDPASPFHPTPNGRTYVAYFRPFDLATNGQSAFVFDMAASGVEAGMTRAATMMNLEIATGNPAAFESSAFAVAAGTFMPGGFGSWSLTDLGEGDFSGIVIWEDSGQLVTANGRLTWVDPNEPHGVSPGGGADMVGANGANQIEFTPGALYWNRYEIEPSDFANDATYPSIQLEARPFNPSFQAASVLRTDGDHYDGALASGGNGFYDIFWNGPDNGAGGGASSDGDDLIMGFNLFNANGIGLHGGAVTLHSARYWALGPDDPNVP
jgi:hypothetical protein